MYVFQGDHAFRNNKALESFDGDTGFCDKFSLDLLFPISNSALEKIS